MTVLECLVDRTDNVNVESLRVALLCRRGCGVGLLEPQRRVILQRFRVQVDPFPHLRAVTSCGNGVLSAASLVVSHIDIIFSPRILWVMDRTIE
jgi:hypothetical protein